jgi:hypothetical protein
MDLFLTPHIEIEKVAAEVRLPDDPNQWPNEILQELYKQVPYISDFDPKVIMDRVDGERGFGFGHVEVRNKTEAPNSATPEAMEAAGIREARIPIIIKEGKLYPLDLLVTADSKVMPLTENRIRQALFRPQVFDITSKTPGDQSMIGQLYPPHRSNFGYGGAGVAMGAEGMGKTGADLTQSAREKIKPKNFAIPEGNGPGGTGKYPIHDEQHARVALGLVRLHGTPEERARVYAAVAAKYPHLAADSSVPAVREKAKSASVLGAILHTINESDYEKFAARFLDDNLRAAYVANHANTSPSLQKLSSYQGWNVRKVASGLLNSVKPTVMQITKVAEGYKVKSASHNLWVPKEEIISRGQLVKSAGTKIALDVDLNKTVTLAEGANVDKDLPDDEHPEQIKDFGIWKVKTTEGEELVGYVFPTLLDMDGQPVPVALFTNGSQAALQADMAGVRVGDGASLFEGHPVGKGIFFKVLDTGRAVGTIPLTMHAQLEDEGGVALMVETFDGQQLHVVQQPGVELPTMVDERTSIIPADWSWLPLDRADTVALVEHAEDFSKHAEARREIVSVTIRSGGPDSYSISGMATEKLGHDQTQFLSFDDAVFLLGGFGVAPSYAQEKLACAYHWQQPVQCRIGRTIETLEDNVNYAAEKTALALDQYVNLRRDLIKEAAFIPDPMAVDTVLSLGFINPENISIFIASLPSIDEAQQKMCELLLAARMGLPDLSVPALEKAVKATEEVFEGLKVLAFQKN